jgi:hypothetical protein
MVEVVWCDNLVFNPLVVKLDCVLSIIASKHKEVLNRELIIFRPPNFKSFLLLARLLLFLKCGCVKKIEYFLAVDLQETARNRNRLVFHRWRLWKHVSDSTDCQTRIHFGRNGLNTSLFTMLTFVFVLVALHCKSLSWASLTIGEYSSMKAINNSIYKPWNLKLFENFFLTAVTVNYFVKLERFHFLVVHIDSEWGKWSSSYEIWLASDST